ncbi:MAG: GAF domain-containing protein [Pseudomonadota bacterium]
MDSNPYVALEEILKKDGLKAGLAWLNSRVPHRFTAVYLLDKLMLSSREVVDKEGESATPPVLLAVPLETSFCQYVLRDGHFVTGESGTDERLDGHPYQGAMGSYVGLPLQARGKELMGTFCHFDFENRELADEEFAFLQRVARLLPRFV